MKHTLTLLSTLLLAPLSGLLAAGSDAATARPDASAGPPRSATAAHHPEFEKLFHASLDFYSKLQRTPNGL